MKQYLSVLFGLLLWTSTASATVLTYELKSSFDPCCIAYEYGEAASPLEGKPYVFRFSYDTEGDPLQQHSPASVRVPGLVNLVDEQGIIGVDSRLWFGSSRSGTFGYWGTLWFEGEDATGHVFGPLLDLNHKLPIEFFTISYGGFHVFDDLHGYSGGNEYDNVFTPQLRLVSAVDLATPEPSSGILALIGVALVWVSRRLIPRLRKIS